MNRGIFICKGSLGEDALLLKRTDRAGTKSHSNLLAVYYKSFLLEVRLEHAICATQREANVVAELLAFTGEFALCCHNLFSLFPFYVLYRDTRLHFTFFDLESQGEGKMTHYWRLLVQ